MRDLASDIVVRPSLAQATRNSTATGTAIDRSGYESLAFALVVGSHTDGEFFLTVEHSDDNAEWSEVSSNMIVGDAMIVMEGSPPTPSLENAAATIAYVGGKKYARPVLNVGGGSPGPATGAVTSVVAILGHAHHRPAR